MTREVVIVEALRTAFTRAGKGSFRDTRPDTLAAAAIKAVLDASKIDPALVEDSVIGCAFPEAEQGMNVARVASVLAGLPVETAAMTINRFCSSGVQSMAMVADRIAVGGIDVAIAGGTESMSMIPMGGNKVAANPTAMSDFPLVYTGMGTTAEIVAKRFDVSRVDQDAFALESHRRALEGWEKNLFANEIFPVTTMVYGPDGGSEMVVSKDECPRPGGSAAAMAKLRPAFDPLGTVTAGNASPLTDGAGAALLMAKETADKLGMKAKGYFRDYTVAGVPPEIMGIGPVPAIRKLLKRTGLDVKDIDLIELNEAFAAQSLYCVRELGLDPLKVNRNGGAIAIGHPLGATGARLVATALSQLEQIDGKYAIVSMCIGGGMGFACLLERA